MPCALEVIDTRLQSTSHIHCNGSFSRKHFSKGRLIRKPVSVCTPENRDIALTILPLGHDSDWNLAPFLPDIREVNKVTSLTSGPPDTEGLDLSSTQPRILCCFGQANERNMHDQADSSKPVSIRNPHEGSTLRQSGHRKDVCNSSTAVPLCHVVAKKFCRPVTVTLRSDSSILHDGDKPVKRNSRKKGNKKGKQYKRTTRKKLNLASEITFEECTHSVFPMEVLPTNLLVDKLSETTSSVSSSVKEAHSGKNDDENNNNYVECNTTLNLSTLGMDGMDSSEWAVSSNDAAGGRLSCSCVPYLNDISNVTDSSEFEGSTITEHGLEEESKSYQKLSCTCHCYPTTDSFFSRWNNDSRNYHVDVEAGLTIKDQNRNYHLQPGSSTGPNNVRMQCHLIGSDFNATHVEDTNGHFSTSYSSKDVTDSCSHTDRVQCSSEACSSKASLEFSSGKKSRRSRKTPSYSDLTASNRVINANRHKTNGKDSSAVWQKVEKNEKVNSKAGHSSNSLIQDKSAQEQSDKGLHQDQTRHKAKHNQSRKACKQESPNGTVELESPKDEDDALDLCPTFSRPIYSKQAPFAYQQRSSSSKQGSESLRNCYAPRNGVPKVPKDYFQQEELPMLQLVHATKGSGDTLAVTVVLTGVDRPAKGNESSRSGIQMAADLVPDLAPQAASNEAHISDPRSLSSENKGTSAGSKNFCTESCAAETEEARRMTLTTENNPQESCKLYSAAGHLSQKWVPVGKKEASNVTRLDVEGTIPDNDVSDSVGPVLTNGEDNKLGSEMTQSEHVGLKCQANNGTETGYSKIKESVDYVYAAQQRVEDIQLRIGMPLADIEQFIYSASPVVCCSPCPAGCKYYLQEYAKNGLCLHQTPNITLSSVWQWYEEPGCYGLEVKPQGSWRSKGLWNSHRQFTTYFVPYLSAVQLFSQPKKTNGENVGNEAIHTDLTYEESPHLSSPPIFAKLMPRQCNPRNGPSTLPGEDGQQSANSELLFEFFESEQPYLRRQLFDKVKELIAGVKPLNSQISGDPKNLERNLHDLHPASWYCVAWYPIYRIPDGKFQAAFLTYHSLGHWTHGKDQAAVLPVVGLQSYNDKAERWFEMRKSDADESEALKERLRTLKGAAAAMSRASVVKKMTSSRNRHPDYEFFLSRW